MWDKLMPVSFGRGGGNIQPKKWNVHTELEGKNAEMGIFNSSAF